MFLPFLECYVNETVQYVTVCIWPLLFTIVLLIFNYIVIRFYFLFLSSLPFMDISQFINLQVEIAALFLDFINEIAIKISLLSSEHLSSIFLNWTVK